MKAKLCSLLMFGLVPSVLCAQGTPALLEFKAKVVAKYGTTSVGTFTSGPVRRLELTLTDLRFLGTQSGFVDSAKVVARFAAGILPSGYQPDSLTVKIVTADTGSGTSRHWVTSSATFALAKLK